MKKKIVIPIIAGALLLAVLFVPIPQGHPDDGGTRVWGSLTYKIVEWNRFIDSDTENYRKTRVYLGKNAFKSIDELWETERVNVENVFVAYVSEINGDSATVKPFEGEIERSSSDKIVFNITNLDKSIKRGDMVKITYTGDIMEVYPARINAVKWERSYDMRHKNYDELWLDKATATKVDGEGEADVGITEIYADCFFVRSVVPFPETFKINGKLSDEWCVGDQVYVKYDNIYRSGDDNRVEADLISVEVSTFVIDPNACYKPVIYLYPEEETKVSVNLTLNGELTCTYPAYGDGWNVTASPDGILTDENGMMYNYLYWEGDACVTWDMSRGFCVKGDDTAKFLEDALAKLGLNRREANEFIVYWLPLMQENPYNIISFQSDVYTDAAVLKVTPNPDTVIRVFMAYSASETYVEIEEQELLAPERTGFTVVEWGGSEVK